jgi:hypothetical protein
MQLVPLRRVKPGNNILIADGSISIRVDSIVSKTVLKGTVLNTKKLGERKNCNLPGVKVDIPVLTVGLYKPKCSRPITRKRLVTTLGSYIK